MGCIRPSSPIYFGILFLPWRCSVLGDTEPGWASRRKKLPECCLNDGGKRRLGLLRHNIVFEGNLEVFVQSYAVIKLASSEARNNAARATSIGISARPSTPKLSKAAFIAGSDSMIGRVIAVRMTPGMR